MSCYGAHETKDYPAPLLHTGTHRLYEPINIDRRPFDPKNQ